jgi:hypothetical protein
MKPILGLLALLSWLPRCHGLEPPRNPHHGQGHAGNDTSVDAGVDASAEPPESCGDDAGPGGKDAEPGGKDGGPDPRDAGPSNEDAGPRGDAAMEPIDAAVEPNDAAAEEACLHLPPGLFSGPTCDTYAEGIRKYKPKFELWSDGAIKERFIYLPPGTTIDTSNPDRWSFPVETRLYKTFVVDGKKIETRVMTKTLEPASIDSWTMEAWAWNEAQDSVALVSPEDPDVGVRNALGTQHDIPSRAQCRSCHTMAGLDAVNGFGALQLNHEAALFTLKELVERDLLVDSLRGGANVSVASALLPGDQDAQAALGYLHVNCGHCHGGAMPRANLMLWATVGHTSLTEMPIFQDSDANQGAVCECLGSYVSNLPDKTSYAWRLNAGHAEESAIVARMSIRNSQPDAAPPLITRQQMPPLGTDVIDELGVKQVTRWINSLDSVRCESKTCIPPLPRPPAMPAAPAAGAAAPVPATTPMPAVAGAPALPLPI